LSDAAAETGAALAEGYDIIFQAALLRGMWGGWSDFLVGMEIELLRQFGQRFLAPLTAANATLALNTGECARRLRFVIRRFDPIANETGRGRRRFGGLLGAY